ncbi:MAG: hypothetical protein JXB14_00650 [Candidatus Altiarchaeota archaeon]|nr:hypothetical protein [Candidatus Altiarchaeota archaeon]
MSTSHPGPRRIAHDTRFLPTSKTAGYTTIRAHGRVGETGETPAADIIPFTAHFSQKTSDSLVCPYLQNILQELKGVKKMYYRKIKGNWYAYESVREGDTVRSIYRGKGNGDLESTVSSLEYEEPFVSAAE